MPLIATPTLHSLGLTVGYHCHYWPYWHYWYTYDEVPLAFLAILAAISTYWHLLALTGIHSLVIYTLLDLPLWHMTVSCLPSYPQVPTTTTTTQFGVIENEEIVILKVRC